LEAGVGVFGPPDLLLAVFLPAFETVDLVLKLRDPYRVLLELLLVSPILCL
jgi:hypothetical protein